jgi:hypothetical protein
VVDIDSHEAAPMIETLERLDEHAEVRNWLRLVAKEKEEWAGIPMPLTGEQLVVDPSYPWADMLMKIGLASSRHQIEEGAPTITIRSLFWFSRWRFFVATFEDDDGKVRHQKIIGTGSQADKILGTLGCCDAWGIEQEARAVALLGTLVRHRAFKHYMLTGSFLETSPRSGITYVFRRLRPTIAIKAEPEWKDEKRRLRILATLCMHPIAYYADSWAGAMCPTDDVIAHLMLMRGDEKLFWRRSNQHEARHHESGL